MDIGISIEWEEFEPNGETCAQCKEIITGKVYVMMLQVGGPMEAKPMGTFCKACQFGDEEGTESDENE